MMLSLSVPVKATSSDALPVSSSTREYITEVNGSIMRVYGDESAHKVMIEYCNDKMQVTSRKSVNMELPVWGGFYAGDDAYYIVVGQQDLNDQKGVEVFKAIKYDKNWNRLASGSLMSNELEDDEFSYTRNPFDLNDLDLTEVNGHLILATAHQGFVDPAVGQGHTGLYLASFNESDMKATLIGYNLWHSFTQFVRYDGTYLYLLEQSEGSRMTCLSRFNQKYLERMDRPYGENENRYFYDDGEEPDVISLVKYGGERDSAWSIPTHATVDGMELSTNNILTVGSTIDQNRYKEKNVPYNVYITSTPKNNYSKESTQFNNLTANGSSDYDYGGITMSKINDDRFIVSWVLEYSDSTASDMNYDTDSDTLSSSTLQYVIVDGNGTPVTSIQSVPHMSYNAKPIIVNGKVVYYHIDDQKDDLKEQVVLVDPNNGSSVKYNYSPKARNGKWSLNGQTLTLSVQDENQPLMYMNADQINSVNKLILKKDADQSSIYFSGLNGLTSITVKEGTKAFDFSYYESCKNLKTVTLPASVKKIEYNGDYYDFEKNKYVKLFTGLTIIAPKGSYAIKFAKAHDIKYKEIETKKIKSKLAVTYVNYHKVKIKNPKVNSATQYRFYAKLGKKKKSLLGKSKKNTFTTKNLKDGQMYAFSVEAYKGKKRVRSFKAVSITTLKKVSTLKVKSGKKISWKKVKGAKGYQIAISNDKKKGFKTFKTTKKTSFTIKTKKKYVKVRAYVTSNKKKIYAPYSAVKSL
jgi:hypothetical protein